MWCAGYPYRYQKQGSFLSSQHHIIHQRNQNTPRHPIKNVLHQNRHLFHKFLVFSTLKSSKLLFRGVRSRTYVDVALTYPYTPGTSLENELGPGIYTTDDFKYATEYAGRNGALLVYNWSDEGGGIVKKVLV